ncbi:MAG: hypothetical protein AABW64_02190 [Nanoarchaeota archaeon]
MKRGIIAVILAVFFLSSCQNNGDPNTTQPGDSFIGGVKGIDVAFASDEPPQVVLDNNQQEFFLTLLLRNEGEFTVPTGQLIASLSGVQKQAFGLQSLTVTNTLPIAGAQKQVTGGNLPGATEQVEFGKAQYTIDIPADFTTTLRADICYTYQTQALANICLKKDVLRKDLDDVCDVKVPNLPIENSGGPFQVVQAHEDTVGKNKIKFNFKVKNSGIGAIYEPGSFTNLCAGQEDKRDKVKITLTSPENAFQIQCSQLGNTHTGVVRLVNGEKDISCTIDTTNLQDITFQGLVIVTMDYMYRSGVIKQLVVQNAA